MKYIKPIYQIETAETNDIMSTSLEGGATMIDNGDGSADIGTSIKDILGLN